MTVSELKKLLQRFEEAGYGEYEAIVTVDRITEIPERQDIKIVQKEVVIE